MHMGKPYLRSSCLMYIICKTWLHCLFTFPDVAEELVVDIRVKNLEFAKTVTLRVTEDDWRSFSDFQAVYKQSMSAEHDVFTVRLPKNQDISFACCYIPGDGLAQWDNNLGLNYNINQMDVILTCQKDTETD